MKSRSLRVSAFVAAGVAVAALLAGCSSGSGGSGGPIQVQTGFAAGSPLLKALTTVADKYEKENPGVSFTLIPSSANYEQDIKVRLAAHNPPDIWMTHGWSRDRYKEFLAPLQNESWNKDVNPALDDAMRTPSGAIYALPLDTDVAGVLYNKDVLEKAGVDVATLQTWADFDKAAEKIKATGVTPISVSGKANGPAGNLIDWTAPGIYTKAELASLKKGAFTAASYSPLLQLVESWQKSGYINADYSSATQDDEARALGSSQAAFVFQQNAIASQALTYSPDANLGFFPIPSDTGKPYLVGGEMDAFGVSKTSSHLKDATAFINYLAKPANEAVMASAAGAIPGLTSAETTGGTLVDSYNYWVTDQKTELLPYFDRVYLPNGMWNTLVTTTDSVITGQSNVSDATGQVATDFKSLYGQK